MVQVGHARDGHLEVQSDVPGDIGGSPPDAGAGPCDALRQAGSGYCAAASTAEKEVLAWLHARRIGDPRRSRGYLRPLGQLGPKTVKLLLDTHIWIWGEIRPERVSRAVQRQLANPSNEIYLSPV